MIADQGLGGRLPLLRPDDLTSDARALYDRLAQRQRDRPQPFRVTSDEGEFIGPFNACLQVPATGGAFLEMHEAEAKTSALPARLREIVILSVGAAWSAPFELYAHCAVAAKCGLEPALVEALSNGKLHAGLTDAERAVQKLTLMLMRDRYVDDETYDACERLIGRPGLVAIIFLAAAYAGTSTVLKAFAVPAPPVDSDVVRARRYRRDPDGD